MLKCALRSDRMEGRVLTNGEAEPCHFVNESSQAGPLPQRKRKRLQKRNETTRKRVEESDKGKENTQAKKEEEEEKKVAPCTDNKKSEGGDVPKSKPREQETRNEEGRRIKRSKQETAECSRHDNDVTPVTTSTNATQPTTPSSATRANHGHEERNESGHQRVQKGMKLSAVVAELVAIWNSPISDPLDTPEMKKHKEKLRKEMQAIKAAKAVKT